MKQSEKYMIFIGIVYILFMILALIYSISRRQSLDNNATTGKAIIEHLGRARFGYKFSYHFNIDEQEYKGTGIYFPDNDTLSVGDTITIVYDKTSPTSNASVRDFDSRKGNLYYLLIIPIIVIFIYWGIKG